MRGGNGSVLTALLHSSAIKCVSMIRELLLAVLIFGTTDAICMWHLHGDGACCVLLLANRLNHFSCSLD